MSADRRCLKLADAADEIARIDAILRPLSLAVPELRVLMHSDDDGRTPKGASMRCWHARCGHDWTDPVFEYSCMYWGMNQCSTCETNLTDEQCAEVRSKCPKACDP